MENKNTWASLVAQLVKNSPTMQKTPVRFLGQEDPLEMGWAAIPRIPIQYSWAFLMSQMAENLPAMWETWVQSLGWKDCLEEDMQPTPGFLPGESPWTEKPGGLQSVGSQRVRHD